MADDGAGVGDEVSRLAADNAMSPMEEASPTGGDELTVVGLDGFGEQPPEQPPLTAPQAAHDAPIGTSVNRPVNAEIAEAGVALADHFLDLFTGDDMGDDPELQTMHSGAAGSEDTRRKKRDESLKLTIGMLKTAFSGDSPTVRQLEEAAENITTLLANEPERGLSEHERALLDEALRSNSRPTWADLQRLSTPLLNKQRSATLMVFEDVKSHQNGVDARLAPLMLRSVEAECLTNDGGKYRHVYEYVTKEKAKSRSVVVGSETIVRCAHRCAGSHAHADVTSCGLWRSDSAHAHRSSLARPPASAAIRRGE